MPTPSRNMMPIQKFAFDRTKAQQSATRSAIIAKAGKPQKARPVPVVPLRTAPAPRPKPRTSTRIGDRLKANLNAAKLAAPDDIQKLRCAVRAAVK